MTHLGLLDRGFQENKHLYVLNNTKSLITLLVSRPEIDFIVADDITIGYRAELVGVKKSQLKRIYEIKDLTLDFHLACSNKTDKKIINTLTKHLAAIHQDGTYRRVLSKWQQQLPTNIMESINNRKQ